MDFSFTDEQNTLRQSVAGYLQKNYDFAGSHPDAWEAFQEFGLLALPFAEELGGLGGSIVDVVAVAELFGESLVVEPFVPSIVLAGRALAATADNAAARGWLTTLIEGEALGAFAHEGGTVIAERTGDGYRLTGHKRVVLGAAEAGVLVVTSEQGLVLVEADRAGLHLTPFTTIDGRSAAHVTFADVEVPADHLLSDDANVVTAIVDDAILVLAAEAVGAMGALLRQTSEYASIRKQFGQAIVGFQAVAHRLADMKIAYTKARATLIYTAALAEAGQATPLDISILKSQVGRLGRQLGEAAIQTHGGVGMTDELAVGHYVKRLLAIDTMFGNSDYHLRLVGAGV